MLIAYCDGGCNNKIHGNAYGSFLVSELDPDGATNVLGHRKFDLDSCYTSNEAEYRTLISLLEWLVENSFDKRYSGIREIIIYSDSRLMVNQVNGGWKVYADNLVELRGVVMPLLKSLGNIKLLWIPRKEIVNILGH